MSRGALVSIVVVAALPVTFSAAGCLGVSDTAGTGGGGAYVATGGSGGSSGVSGSSWAGGNGGSTESGGTSASGGSSGTGGCTSAGCPAPYACGVAIDNCGQQVSCGLCPTSYVCTPTQRCASPEEGSYDQPGYTCNGGDNKDPAQTYSGVLGPNGAFSWINQDSDCKRTMTGTYALSPPNKITTHWTYAKCEPEGCLLGSSGDGGVGFACDSAAVDMTYYWTYTLTPTTLDLQQEPPYTSCSTSGIHFSFVRTGGPT